MRAVALEGNSIELARRGFKVLGIDTNQKYVDLAREKANLSC